MVKCTLSSVGFNTFALEGWQLNFAGEHYAARTGAFSSDWLHREMWVSNVDAARSE